MAVVDQSSVDVPLSLFSSLNTELSPSDIPEGISPDNGDICYLPGSVFTRPGYSRVFVSALQASGRVTYEKSFVLPTKAIKNLYMTNDGTLWVEDVTNAPGVATVLFSSCATTASSVTAFGREYIALSDGVHGEDMPIQYDGTNIWRVTQDGPAVPPVVVSTQLPSTTLAGTGGGGGSVGSVTSIQVTNGGAGYYNGGYVTISGGGGSGATAIATFINYNGYLVGITVTNGGSGYTTAPAVAIHAYSGGGGAAATAYISGGGGGGGGTPSLTRANNVVSAATTSAHGLSVGYQAQIQGAGVTQVGGSISTITLNNEDTPGIATVTTSAPHGLLPSNQVNITGVNGAAVGSGIANVAFSGGIVTITTSAAHGLASGSEVTIAATTAKGINGNWPVAEVPSTTTFTFAFNGSIASPTGTNTVAAYSASDTGTVTYLWPLADVDPAQNYFTVQTAPSPTTFTIQLAYTDGTWTGGTVTFGWDGIFYVTETPTALTFQYQQYGPNATTAQAGTVTPYGQATPGIHQVRQCYLFQSGAISKPSPPATFVANGSQYVSVSGLSIGPANVAARILLFTGAGGAYFFYIPTPAQVNGLVVSTATQINDNTTTSVVLDFSDNTLYAAIGCSIPGNNLAAQVTLGATAGFFTYASRLQAWGERNKVQNFLNMGFDADAAGVNAPQGWTITGTTVAGVTVSLTTRPPGSQWRISTNLSQTLAQSAYADSEGTPILLANTPYTWRLWLKASYLGTGGPNLTATISSASSGFSSTATITNASMSAVGAIVQADFSLPMPATIPTDMMFSFTNTVTTSAYTVTIDELELIYTEEPYLDTQERLSYVDNPEGFNGLTGVLGPEDDASPIMNHGVIRNTLYLVTGGSLHETQDNGSTEPSGWGVNHVADNCGAWSISAIARNPQGIGSAGKEWMTWSGPDGAQIFLGQQPVKISQEIQSLWDAMDESLAAQCWTANDQTSKRCYYGIPLSSSQMQVLVLDYRNLSGEQIAELPPVHISFTGKMIASDLTRKWTQWNGGNFYCGGLMYRSASSQPVMVFGGQNLSGGANVYTLDSSKHTDDDYGIIPAYYITYFFVSHEMEAALQLGSHRKAYQYLTAYAPSIGTISFTPYLCSLANPQASTPAVITGAAPAFDYEMDINVITSRCAFKIQATPLMGQTDTYFSLQKMIVNMKRAPWQPVRGSAGGSY